MSETSLLTNRDSRNEILIRVKKNAAWLGYDRSRVLGAVITDSTSKGKFTVCLLEDKQVTKNEIARLLKTTGFLISFYVEDKAIFNEFLPAAYPEETEAEESVNDESLIAKENPARGTINYNEDDERGILPEDQIADDADKFGRIDLTDTEEFDKNSRKKLSELATIEFARLILYGFINSGGSDLYLEPQKKTGRIRIMTDDLLETVRDGIKLVRFEDLARCLIAMTRRSSAKMRFESIDSDIKVTALVNGESKDFEFRFHSHPTVRGTSCVIRSQSNLIKDFAQSGLEEFQINLMKKAGDERQGLILITGATGSGKSGTLECLYDEHERAGSKKIIEIVDSVEFVSYERDQIEVAKDEGFSWDDAFAACLRSKPHIIGIGEMRGVKETYKAIEAAMTGHLVFGTYHAGNILKTIDRLRQMGVDMLQLAPSLNLIHSQILIRKLCVVCKQPDAELSDNWGKLVYKAGAGCDECAGKGYRGKTALAESLVITEEIEEMLIKNSYARDILNTVRLDEEFIPFAVTARKKIWDGITSEHEVIRMLGKVYEQFYGNENWRLENIFEIAGDDKPVKPENQKSKKDERLEKIKNLSERGGTVHERDTAKQTYDKLKSTD